MATNLALDDKLIDAAVELGGHPDKKAAVTAALQEYVNRHRQQEMLGLFGQLEYEPGYDCKRPRRQS